MGRVYELAFLKCSIAWRKYWGQAFALHDFTFILFLFLSYFFLKYGARLLLAENMRFFRINNHINKLEKAWDMSVLGSRSGKDMESHKRHRSSSVGSCVFDLYPLATGMRLHQTQYIYKPRKWCNFLPPVCLDWVCFLGLVWGVSMFASNPHTCQPTHVYFLQVIES